jgi:hypothetical protein
MNPFSLCGARRNPIMNQSPPDVRVLPMSGDEDEFKGRTAIQVQSEFFMVVLPLRQAGRYYYRTAGLSAEPGTIVLFQFANQIITCAALNRIERFSHPTDAYHGALHFDVATIKIFDPIGSDVMTKAWPKEFKGFGRVKTKLPPSGFAELERNLTGIREPLPSLGGSINRFDDSVRESLSLTNDDLLSRIGDSSPYPKRVFVTAMVFVRNPNVVAFVLRRAQGICEQCKNPAPFVRRSDGSPYLEVHHLDRLADGGKDTIENARAMCPNCHRHAHYA